MKVLFVDDEPRVLEALERSLRIAGVGWETRFVTSGEAALLELERSPFDVIVTDMRMPGMDGAALLAAVSERAPAVVRIVLSGQAEEGSALRVVRVAHQFLAKPCDAKTLRNVVERAGRVHCTLTDPVLRAMVGGVDRLPTALHVYRQLSDLLAREDASADAVTNVVRQDPAMASKLLQFANSAFFARSREIPDVRSAVIHLGTKTIKNLALGVGVFDAVGQKAPSPLVSIEKMQERAFAIGELAAALSDQSLRDSAFMAGLLCDIGELVLATKAPERLTRAWQAASVQSRSRVECERAEFGASHCEVGAYLLGLWGLPFPVVAAIALHHAPKEGAQTGAGLEALVSVAAGVVMGDEPDGEAITNPVLIKLRERAHQLMRQRESNAT